MYTDADMVKRVRQLVSDEHMTEMRGKYEYGYAFILGEIIATVGANEPWLYTAPQTRTVACHECGTRREVVGDEMCDCGEPMVALREDSEER